MDREHQVVSGSDFLSGIDNMRLSWERGGTKVEKLKT